MTTTEDPVVLLRRRLAATPVGERSRLLLELVDEIAARILGRPRPCLPAPTRAFRDLGLFGSAATTLRGEVGAAIGQALPTTVLFDHPTPAALADHLHALLSTPAGTPAPVVSAPDPTGVEGEEIAIVGMACRAPGGVRSPEQLWRLVLDEVDAIGPFPEDRGWGVAELYDPDPARIGKVYTRHGGFLYDAADFDAGFFGISPREAVTIDPQHRLLLENSWEALEDAGIDPLSLRGSRTGVFSGVIYSDYATRLGHTPPSAEGYLVTGSMPSVASGRVAYVLGLAGPAITVDTACSSSLVTLHLACQALRQGECTLALAGGVTVMSTPAGFVEFSRQRVLATDGRCRSFATEAGGSSWSEGIGTLVVERLSDALRNGHRPLALVRAAAVNSDGTSNGLTAPNGLAQQQVIRQALAVGRLRSTDVDVVEAHGAGTKLGDPIEAQALLATYGQGRDPDQPLWLGSLKSNLGHTQAAAGVLGLIKMILAMREGVLPRSLHCATPSTFVDWSAGSVEVLRSARPWPKTDRPRRAGISSFGISGTNAHVVIEQPPDQPVQAAPPWPGRQVPWLLSAHDETALRAQAARLAEFVRARPELDPVAVGRSLAVTRAALTERAAVLGGDRDELVRGLAGIAGGAYGTGALRGHAGPGPAVFVFPGQGSQWAGMATELLDTSAVFRASIESCAQSLKPFVDWSLLGVLRGEPGAPTLDRVDVVQPALFAVMVSLAALWRGHGIRPAVVLGHSQGEIAAAQVAGALSLSDAARVVALRSRALLALSGQGGMVSVRLPLDRVRARIAEWGDRLSVAAVNSGRSVVVSGEPDALTELLDSCAAGGVRAQRIPVDYASHSPHIDRIRAELLDLLADIRPVAGELPCYSTVTGEPIDTATMDAEYWVRNLRHTVEFAPTVRRLIADGHTRFLEMSPHPVLCTAIQEIADEVADEDVVAIGSLRRDEGGFDRFVSSLAQAHVSGVEVDWQTVFDPAVGVVSLPTYAFQRQRYWLEDDAAPRDLGAAGLTSAGHPLLGAEIPLAEPDGAVLFTGSLSTTSQPWLADHAVRGVVLLPGTAFVELARHAGDRVGCGQVEELVLHAPLVLPAEGAMFVRVWLGPADDDGRRALTVHSRQGDATEDEPWTRNATATLTDRHPAAMVEDGTWPPDGAVEIPLADCYPRLAAAGLDYGPAFQGLRACWRVGDELCAEVAVSSVDPGFGIHPALLDAALHPLALAGVDGSAIRLPFSWSGVGVFATGATELRVRLRRGNSGRATLRAVDPAGQPVVVIEELDLRPVSLDTLRANGAEPAALLRLTWSPTVVDQPADRTEWTVLGPDADDLADELTALGQPVATRAELAGDWSADVVLLPMVRRRAKDVPGAVHAATNGLLAVLHTWLAEDRFADSTLVLVTRHALVAGPDEEPDPVHGAALGLLRSAQAEHPDRFRAVDLDRDDRSVRALGAAIALGQPQVAVRAGRPLLPRLTRLAERSAGPRRADWPADGVVLLSGGTGVLGSLVARHLVTEWGVPGVALLSRTGTADAELVADLAAAGAWVRVLTADAGDRAALGAAIADLTGARRLIGVVHAAGVLDDGALTSLTPGRVDRVLWPKVDAAWHLHELTSELDLSFFVLFSSAAGVLGTAGQANYAAANGFLDGLAHWRGAHGLPAVSLAWGLWHDGATAVGLAGSLAERDVARLSRSGVVGLSTSAGLALFDRAIDAGDRLLVPIGLDLAAIRADTTGTSTPALLRTLVHRPTRHAAGPTDRASTGSLADRLATVPAQERDAVVLALVRGQVAAVLGYADTAPIDPRRAFLDLGFDSLRAVELRNRLTVATGVRLPATVVFDYPNATELARHLRETAVPSTAADPPADPPADPDPVADRLATSSIEEIMAFIDNGMER